MPDVNHGLRTESEPLTGAKPQSWAARNETKIQRVFQRVPGVCTWVILACIYYSVLYNPFVGCMLVLLWTAYHVAESFYQSAYALIGYSKIADWEAVDWWAKYCEDLPIRQQEATAGTQPLAWEDVVHVAVIPAYKEPIEKLRETFNSIAMDKNGGEQIICCLALEEREQGAAELGATLKAEYQHSFRDFLVTIHPKDLPGEVKGKSSNVAWAAKQLKRTLCDDGEYNMATIVYTVADADTLFHPRFFDAVTYHFCFNPDRYTTFWQAPVALYPNIYEVPGPVRSLAVITSVYHVSSLADPLTLVFPLSCYTLSMTLAERVGGWDTDVIPEDWHMFLKSWFRAPNVKVAPILLPLANDSPQADGWWNGVYARYVQAKRHAWGIIEFSYAATQTVIHRRSNMFSALAVVMTALKKHVMRSTAFFVPITVPLIATLHPEYRVYPLNYLILVLASFYAVGVFNIIVFMRLHEDFKARFLWNTKWMEHNPLRSLEWLWTPMATALFASIASMDAQTSQLWTHELNYIVAPKGLTQEQKAALVRRKNEEVERIKAVGHSAAAVSSTSAPAYDKKTMSV